MSETDRLEYVHALTDAILAWTQRETARRPRVFHYGNADLTGAVRRVAHFELVRHDPLYRAFRGEPFAGSLPLRFRWLRSVVEHVLARRVPCRQPLAQYAWDTLAGAAPWLMRYRHWRQRSFAARHHEPRERPRVVFYAVTPKMYRYLRPLAQALQRRGEPYAFGTAFGMRADFYLAQRQPCLAGAAGRSRSFRRRHPSLRQLRFFYDRIYAELARARPACVVVCEGCHSTDSLVAEAARELGIRSVCLQQGWAPKRVVNFMDMCFDRFVTWGEGFAEHLRPLNPEQRFSPLGSHILPAGAALEETWNRLDTPERRAVAVALQPDVNAIPAGTSRAMLEMTARVAAAYPSQHVLVREHPNRGVSDDERALLDGFANVSWNDPNEIPLCDFLAQSAVVVALSSTTLLEATVVGAVPVVVNLRPNQRHNPDLHAAGAGLQAEGIAEAERLIARLITDDAYRRAFRAPMRRFAAHYFRQDGDPLSRILDHLLEQ